VSPCIHPQSLAESEASFELGVVAADSRRIDPEGSVAAAKSLFAGAVYEGVWKDGLKDGLGTHVFASGARYDGMYRKDLMEGDGTYTFEVRMLPLSIPTWSP